LSRESGGKRNKTALISNTKGHWVRESETGGRPQKGGTEGESDVLGNGWLDHRQKTYCKKVNSRGTEPFAKKGIRFKRVWVWTARQERIRWSTTKGNGVMLTVVQRPSGS